MGEQQIKNASYFEDVIREMNDLSLINLEIIYEIKEKLNKIKPMNEPVQEKTKEVDSSYNSVADYFDLEIRKQHRIKQELSNIRIFLTELV